MRQPRHRRRGQWGRLSARWPLDRGPRRCGRHRWPGRFRQRGQRGRLWPQGRAWWQGRRQRPGWRWGRRGRLLLERIRQWWRWRRPQRRRRRWLRQRRWWQRGRPPDLRRWRRGRQPVAGPGRRRTRRQHHHLWPGQQRGNSGREGRQRFGQCHLHRLQPGRRHPRPEQSGPGAQPGQLPRPDGHARAQRHQLHLSRSHRPWRHLQRHGADPTRGLDVQRRQRQRHHAQRQHRQCAGGLPGGPTQRDRRHGRAAGPQPNRRPIGGPRHFERRRDPGGVRVGAQHRLRHHTDGHRVAAGRRRARRAGDDGPRFWPGQLCSRALSLPGEGHQRERHDLQQRLPLRHASVHTSVSDLPRPNAQQPGVSGWRDVRHQPAGHHQGLQLGQPDRLLVADASGVHRFGHHGDHGGNGHLHAGSRSGGCAGHLQPGTTGHARRDHHQARPDSDLPRADASHQDICGRQHVCHQPAGQQRQPQLGQPDRLFIADDRGVHGLSHHRDDGDDRHVHPGRQSGGRCDFQRGQPRDAKCELHQPQPDPNPDLPRANAAQPALCGRRHVCHQPAGHQRQPQFGHPHRLFVADDRGVHGVGRHGDHGDVWHLHAGGRSGGRHQLQRGCPGYAERGHRQTQSDADLPRADASQPNVR